MASNVSTPGLKMAYGVDLSSRSVTVVQVSRSRKGFETRVVLTAPDAGEGLPAEIRENLAGLRATLVGGMAPHESFTRWLQTPLKSLKKAARVMPSLLDIQLPFPLEECVYHFIDFRKSAEGQVDALAVAARTQDVTVCLERYGKAGLDPAILDHEGLALWDRSVAEIMPERNAKRVVACLGVDHCTLAVGSGRTFAAAHGMRVGMDALLAPDAGEAAQRPFVQRAQQVLRSQFADDPDQPVQWIWTGPGAANRDGVARLQTMLQGSFAFAFHDKPDSFLARAYSVRGLDGRAAGCNFRTGALAHPAEARRREKTARHAVRVSLAAGLFLCAINGGWLWMLNRQNAAAQNQLSAVASELTGGSRVPRGQEILTVQRSMEEQDKLVQPLRTAFQPSLNTLLREILATAEANRMIIESVQLKHNAVSIRGASDDWDGCDALAARLREIGFIVDPPQREDAAEDEKVHFTVQGRGAFREQG